MARHPPAHSRVALRSLGGAGNALVGGDDLPRGMPTVALHKETVSRTVPEWATIGQRPRTPNHVGMVEGKLAKAHGEVKTEEVGRLVEQPPIIMRCQVRQAQTRGAVPAQTARPEMAPLAMTGIARCATHSSTACRAGRAELVTPRLNPLKYLKPIPGTWGRLSY